METYKYQITTIDNDDNNILSNAYIINSDDALSNAEYYFNYLLNTYINKNVNIKILDLDNGAIIKQYDSRTDMV